ncbi:MAG TPA: metallophosphoesterase [Candidatus Ruania gallistercoris]|uniref:Metallophosphoesterase n=1 Tax=Candidatus Ruania gallistercoris TaxID=2838746 RepID=A0A9D2J440_9MICO|nr:metallophosphoesterase [Candidatus Ruania gallistercoris]
MTRAQKSPEEHPEPESADAPGATESGAERGAEQPAGPAPRHRVEWWHQLRPMTRRGIRAGIVVVVTGFVSLMVGLLSAQYTGSLGPHEADYSVRLNDEIRVDMGPLGALIVDSPLPLRLGVNVQVKEIPVGLAAPGANPIAGLTSDLQGYTQFFANPEPAIREAANGLITDALGRVTLLWSIQLLVVASARLAGHGLLRETMKNALRQPGVAPLTAAVVVAVTLVPLVDATRSSGNVGRTSAVLDGTPLENARITGRLAPIVDYYGGYVVDAIDKNSEFYSAVQANLSSVFEAERAEAESAQASSEATDAPGDETDDATSTGSDADSDADGHGLSSPDAADEDADSEAVGGGENPTSVESASAEGAQEGEQTTNGTAEANGEQPQSGGPTETSGETAATEDEPELITGVMVTDLHCNIGMAEVIGTAADEFDADLIINAGDTVMAGTSVESYCVSAFADGFGSDRPVVFADGNHDSRTTTEQEVEAGWIPLEGEPVEVAGLRFLGDNDPTISSLGQPTRPTREETVLEMGDRLAAQGCELAEEGEQVDVLLVHSPYAGRQIIEAGCAPMSLSGHLHQQIGPRQLGLGTQYIGASTAGAAEGSPTIGPLNDPATITAIRWDPDTHLPVDYRIVTVGTDTSVVLSDWTPWPAQPTEFVSGQQAED